MEKSNKSGGKLTEVEEDFNFEGNRDETSFFIHMFAGSIAGLMEHVAIFPIDTIKTHMQTARKKIGMRQTLNSIYDQGGFSRFWRGSLLIGSASVPAHALYFSVYEYFKKRLGVNDAGFQFAASALTGVIATFFHDIIITPADSNLIFNFTVIKQRVQLSGSNKCLDCARNIIKHEGFFSFYRSLPITLLMNAPYSITTVMVNENLKKVVQPKKRRFTFLSYFFCAAVAGSCASVITCPMDNIKTKLQTQNEISTCEKVDSMIKDMEREKDGNIKNGANIKNKYAPVNSFSTVHKPECNKEPEVKYKNILSTIRMITREDGFFKGFFKGATPRMLSSAPSCAISWGTYELIKHSLSN